MNGWGEEVLASVCGIRVEIGSEADNCSCFSSNGRISGDVVVLQPQTLEQPGSATKARVQGAENIVAFE